MFTLVIFVSSYTKCSYKLLPVVSKILFPRTRRVTFSHFSASNALILFIQIEAISSSVRVYLKALVCGVWLLLRRSRIL